MYSYLRVLCIETKPLPTTKTTSLIRHPYFIVLYARKCPSFIFQFALEVDEVLLFLFYVLLTQVYSDEYESCTIRCRMSHDKFTYF